MIFRKVLTLRGPNVWSRVPAIEAWLNPEAVRASLGGEVSDSRVSRVEWPKVIASLWDSGAKAEADVGSLVGRLEKETSLEGAIGIVALAIQKRCGAEVDFATSVSARGDTPARVIFQYQEEEIGLAALHLAWELVRDTLAGQPVDHGAEIERLVQLRREVAIGPNTAPVVAAARARGIPVRRLNNDSLIQLGYGARQRRFQTAFTDRTSAIAESISNDKDLTKEMLRAVGVPVPEGRPVESLEDAWAAALEVGFPVVIKPQDADHGDGITLNINSREQLEAAYLAATEVSSNIMVERFAPGAHHRLLVIGGKVVGAARRDSAHVIGDGTSTIAQLVEVVNLDPRRGTESSSPLRKVVLDEPALAVLAEQEMTPESIPSAGSRVFVRRNSHMKDGGDNVDVTDLIHPEVAERVLDATRVIGLDLAGLDVVVEDISRPLEEQGGVILEVNASPWLRQHLRPWHDPPRPVGEAIVSSLFPDGGDGRIPLIAVTGTSGKTTTTRLIAHLYARQGSRVGMSTTDGIYINGRRIETGDCSGPQSAKTVLMNPMVDIAILETAQGGIIREGLAFDQADVTVVTNLGEGDHLELRGVDTLEELARVKRVVVESVSEQGAAVLKADDPKVAEMAEFCAGEVIWFSQDAEHPLVVRQRDADRRSLYVRGGSIVLSRGHAEEPLVPLAEVPMTHQGRVGFQVENVLAAAGAAWAAGLSLEAIRAGLSSFEGNPEQMPARFNLFQVDGATVVIDFPHNAMALEALIATSESFPHERRVLVFAGCNRRDADVIRQGEVIASGFDRLILYEDRGNQDRQDGDLNTLLRQGLASPTRLKDVVEDPDEQTAMERALRERRPGDLIILGVERLEASLAWIQRWLEANTVSRP